MPQHDKPHARQPSAQKRDPWVIATFVLSCLTFLAVSVVPPLFQWIRFDGISVQQNTQWSLLSDNKGFFEYRSTLKIANATKAAVSIDAIDSNFPELFPLPLSKVGSHIEVVKAGSQADLGPPSPAVSGAAGPPKNQVSGDSGVGFPIIVLPETAIVVEVRLAFKPTGYEFPVPGPSVLRLVDAQMALYERLPKTGFKIFLTVNGKPRTLAVDPTRQEYQFK